MPTSNSKVQALVLAGMGPRPAYTSEEEDVATQSPRSTANSSSVETPGSSCKSGTSRGSRGIEDEDSDSSREDEASEPEVEHEDYYAFLRDFAGSFDEEGDVESEPGSQDGDGDEQQEEASREVQSHPRIRHCAPSEDEVDCLLASSTPAGSKVPVEGGRREISIISCEEDDFDDSDIEEMEGGGGSSTARPALGLPCGEYPSPFGEEYDVVKAVQHYASQRAGSRLQQWCEDMHIAVRLKRSQAYCLGLVSKKLETDPKVRRHYAHMRVELLTQVKVLEIRLFQATQATRTTGR